MKNLRNNLILGGLIGLTVVIGLLIYTDVRDVTSYLLDFPIKLTIPILLLTLYNYYFRWVKWQYYLRIIGVDNIKPIDSAAIWVSGFVLALSPGKVAELLKSAVLKSMTGTPIARSAPIIIAERITDGLAMLVLAAVGFGGILVNADDQLEILTQYVPAYFLVLGLIIVGVIVIQIRPLVMWLLAVLKRVPIVSRISDSLYELYDSSYELFRPKPLAIAVGLGIISWFGECVGFYLILTGLGLDASWLLLWQATFMLAAATIIGAVSGLPGGLGAAEFSIAGLIQLLVLGYTDSGFAGTATVLIRLATLWFGVFLGLITAFFFRNRLFPERLEQTWRTLKSDSEPNENH